MCFNWYLMDTDKTSATNIYREDYHLLLLYNSTVLTSLIILTEDKSRNAQSRNKKNTTLPPQRETICLHVFLLCIYFISGLAIFCFESLIFSALHFIEDQFLPCDFFQLNKWLANVNRLLAFYKLFCLIF